MLPLATVASCQAQCLEQDFQVSDLFGGPIFGTASRSQKWARWLNLLSFLYYNTETVPKMGPFRGPVLGPFSESFEWLRTDLACLNVASGNCGSRPFFFLLVAAWVRSRAERPSVSYTKVPA